MSKTTFNPQSFLSHLKAVELQSSEILSNRTEISKIRSADKESFQNAVDSSTNFILETFASKRSKRMENFISDSKNVSKIRSMVADTTCEVSACAGIAKLYFQCNVDIFKYFPNIKNILCDFKKFRIAKEGRISSYGIKRSLGSIQATGYTNINNQIDNELLGPCIELTPAFIEAEINFGFERDMCGTQFQQLVCYMVDTLDAMDIYLENATLKDFTSFLQTLVGTNTVATTGSSLYNVFAELSLRLDQFGYSANKVYFTNLEIIDRMSMEVNNVTGVKTFANLNIACGDNACKVFCLPNGSTVVGLDTTILPKVAGKFQILVVRSEAILGGVGQPTVQELPKDLSILLNKMKNQTVGYKASIFAEATEFAGISVYKTEIL